MIFESAEICAGDDAANAVLCNYNPYFMVVEFCALLEINADSALCAGQFCSSKLLITVFVTRGREKCPGRVFCNPLYQFVAKEKQKKVISHSILFTFQFSVITRRSFSSSQLSSLYYTFRRTNLNGRRVKESFLALKNKKFSFCLRFPSISLAQSLLRLVPVNSEV